jgi:hypothetical protein
MDEGFSFGRGGGRGGLKVKSALQVIRLDLVVKQSVAGTAQYVARILRRESE